jgi:hypothetical protein
MKVLSRICSTRELNSTPGQACVLQDLEATEEPLQDFPPLLGFGLVHDRVLVCFPDPHVLVHFAHEPHDVQPPFTVRIVYTKYMIDFLFNGLCF